MKKLIEALTGGEYTKEFTLNTCKIEMRSLTKKEEVDVQRRIQGSDMMTQIESSKIPIIARSLLKVDGVGISSYPEVDAEVRKHPNTSIFDAIEKYLETFDGGAIDTLYYFYLKLKEEREKERDQILNFTKALENPEQSTNLQNSTENQLKK